MQKYCIAFILLLVMGLGNINAQSTNAKDTVPNVFTPNGDGVNDVFVVPSANLATANCIIYDRYGVKVYEYKGLEGFWDGATSAGMLCPTGTYYYYFTGSGKDGQVYKEHGFVQLIR
jgi:gliding motility-associated-like protein